ncbi:M50 family metallopeptidase [Sphingomonas mesophila]|uniref:M50 family metallopeptidase n=1 Tax=Sphingomonas mesophila TaxID=2303576 RepID=UPI000E586EF4|nr:M50 family metallopeptidase [Sphingomonas mesophila]
MLSQPPVWLIIVAFLGAIGPLVIVHELGHYWVARLFGVGAEQFSIGFGREVGGWTDRRGTRWRIGWLPLGGYVKFVGDADPTSLTKDDDNAGASGAAFDSRPPWQRFLIVLAGPVANFLLAIAIFAAFFAAYGAPATSSRIGSIVPGSAAAQAGLQPGDRIVTVAGRDTPTFEDIFRTVSLRPGETVEIELVRNGRSEVRRATLATAVERDRFGQEYRVGRLGIGGGVPEVKPVPAARIVPLATSYVGAMITATWDGLAQIVTGRRPVSELGGPLRMAQIAGQQASISLIDFVQLIAFFSINLGFINLLPVPALDGGHLVLTAIEGVRRKPVSPRVTEWALRGGLAFLLGLMIVVTFNDLAAFGLWDKVGRLIG